MSSAIVVVPDASLGRLASLASSIHLIWVLRWGSLLDLRIRYSTSDVFDTFPFPRDLRTLDGVGSMLNHEQREIMQRRGLGLTALYNLVHDPTVSDSQDPDIARLRAIHVELDTAVLGAYGWSDIGHDHGFHTYRKIERWTVSPAARTEILDRLLEENHRRAEAETATSNVTSKGRKAKTAAESQEGLF